MCVFVEGNFEVVVDGDLVWSKKSRDQGFPTTDAQVHARTYIHIYMHIYMHTYMHIYMHTYIHTYIHTNKHLCDADSSGRFSSTDRSTT